MCGITGIIDVRSNKDDLTPKIHRMADAMAHRGPDASGFYVENGVALGHRRLSIIDLSECANQPLFDNTKRYCIVFNGEIYNFREVKAQLGEFSFRTQGDSEVLLNAFIKWGPSCLEKINGMFSFIIWDTYEKELFFARDRLGIKPFFYYHDDHKFIFASEIRAITVQDIKKELNEEAIIDYLFYQAVSAPLTIVKNVRQLLPGQYGLLKKNALQIEYYWKLGNYRPIKIPDTYEEVKENVLDRLREAVSLQLVSDVPIGLFLSGGIDSSALLALVAEVSDQPVNTVSVTFGEKQYDESRYAEEISKKYRAKHNDVRISGKDLLDSIPQYLSHLDHPNADGANVYIVSEATKKQGITVALSGLGGDELFAGYHYFKSWQTTAKYKSAWANLGILQSLISPVVQGVMPARIKAKVQDYLQLKDWKLEDIYPILRRVISPSEIKELTKLDMNRPSEDGLLKNNLAELHKFPLLSQFSIAELSGFTANIVLDCTDQMSMAHSLEVRVPFLDHTLVEYCLAIPDKFKQQRTGSKPLLVDALGDRLPASIYDRPKMGFTLPISVWLKTDLKDFGAERIKRFSQRSFVNEAAMLAYWDQFQKGSPKSYWFRLWNIIVLEDWLDRNGY